MNPAELFLRELFTDEHLRRKLHEVGGSPDGFRARLEQEGYIFNEAQWHEALSKFPALNELSDSVLDDLDGGAHDPVGILGDNGYNDQIDIGTFVEMVSKKLFG